MKTSQLLSSMKDRLFDVKDKVIFLTGGTGVLGATYARAFVEAGASLILTDLPERKPEVLANELRETLKASIIALPCNVNQEKSVTAAVEAGLTHFGKIDIVLNNAASTSEFLASQGNVFADFEDYPLSVWEATIQTNLTGMFLVARETGKALRKSKSGSLINISSIYGVVGPDHRLYENMPFKSFPGYSAAKAGVLGLTRWLATYWGPSGIRVNAVIPGGVYNGHQPDFVERYSHRTPLGRMADREDLVGIVFYLASDASRYCTGQSYTVDGGFTAW